MRFVGSLLIVNNVYMYAICTFVGSLPIVNLYLLLIYVNAIVGSLLIVNICKCDL